MEDDDLPGPVNFIQLRPTSLAPSRNYPSTSPSTVKEKLRGESSDAGIPALTWFDHLFEIDSELKKHGIEAIDFAGVLDVDAKSIESASLQLLVKLGEIRAKAKQGVSAAVRRRLVASEALIRHMTLCIVEVLFLEPEPLPEACAVLLRELLGGDNTDLIKKHRPETKIVWELAVQILAQRPRIGIRALAKMVGVAPSTISRWLKDSSFQADVRFWRRTLMELDPKKP